MERQLSRLERWPTGAILLLLLTAALLPLGLVLVWVADQNVRETEQALVEGSRQSGIEAAQSIDSLIVRNILALRVAANGAINSGTDPCASATRALAVSPGVAQTFRLRDMQGQVLCTVGAFQAERPTLLVAPGAVRLWVSPQGLIHYRVGVMNGMATGVLTARQLSEAVPENRDRIQRLTVGDGSAELLIMEGSKQSTNRRTLQNSHPILGGQLRIQAQTVIERTALRDRILLILPLVMWVAATLVSWLLVRRLLLTPLARLKDAVAEYQPGEEGLELPTKFGAATEIREVSLAFERAVDRIEGAEREALEALEGQRRLVREVHHRVKNNLQVVASLLSIHGRSADQPEAKAAYSAIGRRVDALSVVHRHHYAEMEENRGIALRPLLTELAADLRSSAPGESRGMRIDLELDAPSTTQDVAVAAAFLITEIVEYAMLRMPGDNIEISLRRDDELTATLAISSSVLVTDVDKADVAKVQFERIVEGLARQLRSPLDRKLGRYAVSLPIFPDR